MAETALASTDDLAARGVDVELDPARAQSAIDDASALIHAETNSTWIDSETGELVANVPSVALTVCCQAARRSIENPQGLTAETEAIGSYSHSETFTNSSADVYLTKSEKALLRKAAGITGGLAVLTTTRGDVETPSVRCGWYDDTSTTDPNIPIW